MIAITGLGQKFLPLVQGWCRCGLEPRGATAVQYNGLSLSCLIGFTTLLNGVESAKGPVSRESTVLITSIVEVGTYRDSAGNYSPFQENNKSNL